MIYFFNDVIYTCLVPMIYFTGSYHNSSNQLLSLYTNLTSNLEMQENSPSIGVLGTSLLPNHCSLIARDKSDHSIYYINRDIAR